MKSNNSHVSNFFLELLIGVVLLLIILIIVSLFKISLKTFNNLIPFLFIFIWIFVGIIRILIVSFLERNRNTRVKFINIISNIISRTTEIFIQRLLLIALFFSISLLFPKGIEKLFTLASGNLSNKVTHDLEIPRRSISKISIVEWIKEDEEIIQKAKLYNDDNQTGGSEYSGQPGSIITFIDLPAIQGDSISIPIDLDQIRRDEFSEISYSIENGNLILTSIYKSGYPSSLDEPLMEIIKSSKFPDYVRTKPNQYIWLLVNWYDRIIFLDISALDINAMKKKFKKTGTRIEIKINLDEFIIAPQFKIKPYKKN